MIIPTCHHFGAGAIGVYGGGSTGRTGTRRRGWTGTSAESSEAMGIDWMTREECNQAIPPAMTEFIGDQLLRHLEAISR